MKILADFKICISVPLMQKFNKKTPFSEFIYATLNNLGIISQKSTLNTIL